MVEPDRYGMVAEPGTPADIAWRYGQRLLLGERAKWLPPYKLVPSFASADGKTAVYRRRSQVVLTEDSDNTAAAQATTFAMAGSEFKVRIDQYGYARLVRPARSQQHVDPLSNVVDGAADMERDAALAVCKHLNEHVDGIAAAHRFTPSPDHQLVPVSLRTFSEPQPEPPRKHTLPDKDGPTVKRSEMNDYLDARARWLARKFTWDNQQKTLQERGARAAQGDRNAMQEHLQSCLHDVLWPVPMHMALQFTDTSDVRIDVLMPGFDVLPDREAVIAYGNRVSVQRMSEVNKVKLIDRHALGLTLRLTGEIFAALPTVERATVTALQRVDNRPVRFIVSAQVERKTWSRLYANGGVLAEQAEPALLAINARYNLTGLGAFMPIEPF